MVEIYFNITRFFPAIYVIDHIKKNFGAITTDYDNFIKNHNELSKERYKQFLKEKDEYILLFLWID
jgi:hypothetical protein